MSLQLCCFGNDVAEKLFILFTFKHKMPPITTGQGPETAGREHHSQFQTFSRKWQPTVTLKVPQKGKISRKIRILNAELD